jgi:superfamily II DNA or RNA helicase
LPTPFTEAISTLNDRALRRLLGARAFLRGYDYVRRRAVDDIKIEEASARGLVRGTDPAPYQVVIQLANGAGAAGAQNGAPGAGAAPMGSFVSECTCPTFSKIHGHCKHVAALLIALRDQVRGPLPRTPSGPDGSRQLAPSAPGSFPGSAYLAGGAGAGVTAGYSSHASSPAGGYQTMAHNQNNGGYSSASPIDDFGGGGGGGRRGRRSRAARALKLAAAARTGGMARQGGPGAGPFGPSGGTVSTGVDAWLPEPAPPTPKTIEYRLQVRVPGQGGNTGAGGALTITLLDPNARTPLLPSALLFGQGQSPTADREAVRLLARFENEGPRRVGIEVRGEDASDLLPLLKGRRVIVEPQMMELRFGDEPLRPRFDLELSPDGTRILVKSSFVRPGDPRRFTTAQGAWFEGSPGWYVDAQEGVARPIDRRVAPGAIRRLLRAPFIHEPIENLPQLIAQGLPKVALEVGAELPDLSQVADVVDLVPTFRMRAGGTLTEARVALRAAYEDVEMDVRADGMTPPVIVKPPPPADPTVPAIGGPRPRAKCIRCDIAAQQEAAGKLRELGLVPDEEGNGFLVRGDDAIQFWTEGIGQLPEEWDLFVPDDLVDVNVRGETLTANARVSSGVDWLSLRLSFEAEGVAVSQEELGRCLAEGRRYVRLADGSFARLDAQKVRDVLQRQAEILATGGGQGGKLPLSQAGRLQELLEQVGKSNVSETTRELFAKLRDIDEIKGAKKPRNLKASLRPYQEQGFHWLWFLHEIAAGGVLADDMGLGKTVQTLTLLLAVKAADEKAERGKPFKALIVAPTSVVTNWLREMDKFAPSLRHALWHGGDRKERKDELEDADVVVTSYALLRRDEELLAKLDLRYAILDEAQQIKNPLSATARAAKRLKADRRLALTGTPIENRLSEIWSIFDYVSPGLLGPLDKFEERYSRPIDAGDQKAATRLRATIHPFILRRTKSEVAKDLPEKIETEQYCEMTGEQAALYTAVLKEVRAQVMGEVERQGLARSHIQILAGLTRLRQAACDPRLLNLPRKFEDEDSGKLVALRELIQTCVDGGHKVLVFSQFVSMLTIIRRAMEEDGVPYEYLDGSTKDRAERVENFQRDTGPPVFLISLKAGGSGLNLTAADTVIHFDPWWNPAVEDQATDRTHRIGQTKVVTAYRLVAKGTIEEKILELGGKKRELVGAVLSEDAGGAKKLTKSDLEDLFKFDE